MNPCCMLFFFWNHESLSGDELNRRISNLQVTKTVTTIISSSSSTQGEEVSSNTVASTTTTTEQESNGK